MITNDTLAEAISGIASAIRALNWNNRSCATAALVEKFIAEALDKSKAAEADAKQAKQIAELRKMADAFSQLSKLAIPTAESVQVANASNLVAKHMPLQVSTFGGSSGEFGWTGIDSFGKRVTWKVEPVATSAPNAGADAGAIPALTVAMCTLAEHAVHLRDDKLNQLMYTLMLKLNPDDVRAWLDASAHRSAAGTATAEVP